MQHSYLPTTILCDLGTVFTSKMMQELCSLLEIKLKFATVKNPQTIGAIERSHATVKRIISMCKSSSSSHSSPSSCCPGAEIQNQDPNFHAQCLPQPDDPDAFIVEGTTAPDEPLQPDVIDVGANIFIDPPAQTGGIFANARMLYQFNKHNQNRDDALCPFQHRVIPAQEQTEHMNFAGMSFSSGDFNRVQSK